MESEENQWLKKHYRPAPPDGPAAKEIKIFGIHKQLSFAFPNRSFEATKVSDAIKRVFFSYSEQGGRKIEAEARVWSLRNWF